MRMIYLQSLISLVLALCSSAHAAVITNYLEMLEVNNVNESWQTVTLTNTYTNPVVVCTYNLQSKTHKPVVTRVRNATASSFQVRIQRTFATDVPTASNVYCTISETGSYTYPIRYKAGKVVSTSTGLSPTTPNMVNVTPTDITITNPVVIGQVMTENTNHYVTFWQNNCVGRADPPTTTAVCVGKHTGKKTTGLPSPFTETLGFIIAEPGTYILSTGQVNITRGAVTIAGVGNTPPYNYTLGDTYTLATATQAAENGGDGGFAVLYGTNPIGTTLGLAIDEDQAAGDLTRSHALEEVAYWVFRPFTGTYANLIINEVLYAQDTSVPEFIELYATSGGTIYNYLVSGQDGSGLDYRLPNLTVNAGDYVVLKIASGTNTSSNGVHTVFSQTAAASLNNSGDDITLLKPVNNDITTLADASGTVIAVTVDYMSYGSTSVDPPPTSTNGVTVPWNNTNNANLLGTANGTSISLTPNGVDGNTSVCWEITTSNASQSICPGHKPTRDTDLSAASSSMGASNNVSLPDLMVQKTVTAVYDPVNGLVNPKSVPGSVQEYTVTVSNNGAGTGDNGSVLFNDVIVSQSKVCVATVANCKAPILIAGDSGLSLNQVRYSINNGVDNYNHAATADSDGADSAITNLRITTTGVFTAKTTAVAPSMTIKFWVVLE